MMFRISVKSLMQFLLFFLIVLTNHDISAQIPEFKWVKQGIGGYSLQSDISGNIYVAGNQISKLDSAGNVIWNKGFQRILYLRSIDVDKFGNVYTTGSFSGQFDFNPGNSIFNLSAKGWDIHVTKLNSDGDFLWAKQMGGPMDDFSYSISVSPNGTVATTGSYTYLSDFDPGQGKRIMPIQRSNIDFEQFDFNSELFYTNPYLSFLFMDPEGYLFNYESYISTLDKDGAFRWGGFCVTGGEGNRGRSVTFDNNGNLFTVGFYNGTASISAGDYLYPLPKSDNKNGIYISKWRMEGQSQVWTKALVNVADHINYADRKIALDATGNIYIAGCFSDSVDFDPGPGSHIMVSNGDLDAYLLKLNSHGEFLWVKQFSGESIVKGHNIDIDHKGNIIMTGCFSGTVDFDPNHSNYFLTSQNSTDNFVVKLNSSGQFCWAIQLGIPDQGLSVKSTLNGLYLTGHFSQPTDFNPGFDTYIVPPGGSSEFFILSLSNPDVENHVPIDIILSNSSISENAEIGTTVGILSTLDDDTVFTYSLVSGDGDENNDNFSVQGNLLQTKSKFDYETKQIYFVRIQTKDAQGNIFSKKFVLNVTNANEFQFICPPDVNIECSSQIPPEFSNLNNFLLSGGQVFSDCGLNIQSFRLFHEKLQDGYQFKKIVRTYEITDSCGNISQGEHIISVSDKIPPEVSGNAHNLICLSDLYYYFNPWWGSNLPISSKPVHINLEQLNAEGIYAEDNCMIQEILYEDELYSICPIHMIRKFIITDSFYNSTTVYSEYIAESGLEIFLNQDNIFGGCTLDEIEANTSLPFSTEYSLLKKEQLQKCGIEYITGVWCSGEELYEILYKDSVVNTETGILVKRFFTLKDFCNNIASEIQTINFNDIDPPTLVCRDTSIYLDEFGKYEVKLDDILILFGDNCTPLENIQISFFPPVLTNDDIGKTRIIPITARDESGNIVTCESNITVIDRATSINHFVNSERLSVLVYPNPNRGIFDFQLNLPQNGQYNIEIIDAIGKVIYSTTKTYMAGVNFDNLKMNNLAKGAYLLKVTDGKSIAVERFAVE